MVHALSIPNFELLDQFCYEADELLEIVAKKTEIAVGLVGLEWVPIDDMVVCHDRLFLPASAMAWPQVLEHAHGMGNEGI
jgi:hypothetical protein